MATVATGCLDTDSVVVFLLNCTKKGLRGKLARTAALMEDSQRFTIGKRRRQPPLCRQSHSIHITVTAHQERLSHKWEEQENG